MHPHYEAFMRDGILTIPYEVSRRVKSTQPKPTNLIYPEARLPHFLSLCVRHRPPTFSCPNTRTSEHFRMTQSFVESCIWSAA